MKTLRRIYAALLLGAATGGAADSLVIHECGTMTVLEDENGRMVAGINADDEPLPYFVPELIWSSYNFKLGKVATRVLAMHPDVNMRLDTMLLYVHASPSFAGTLDVKAAFRGGWLTAYYPRAQVAIPGFDVEHGHADHLDSKTIGVLKWSGLQLDVASAGPRTDEQAWTAAREVKAEVLTSDSVESEKFLFYRGMANVRPFLTIARDPNTGTEAAIPTDEATAPPRPFWLVEIRPDGAAAFQWIWPKKSSRPFEEKDYSGRNLLPLHDSLETELTSAGLYKDEAEALLKRWDASYFKTPGLRAFCVLPEQFVDSLLPLAISKPAVVKRVMIVRIELITPVQRSVIAALGDKLFVGDRQAQYSSLGQFRAAMLLDEFQARPTPGLESLLKQLGIHYYTPLGNAD